MQTEIDLSIIIVSFNTREILEKCIVSLKKSLNQTKLIYEIIIVDNNSIDGTINFLKSRFPEIKLIFNKKNFGYGRANNQGIEAAMGKTILLLNSDIIVLNNAIGKLFEYCNTRNFEVITGGRLYNTDMSPQSSCGPAYTLFMIIVALFFKGDYLNLTRYSPDSIKEVDWIMGACMMAQKEIFTKIGKFDENIFMYMDEIDYQFRAKKLGVKIYYYPHAHFIHMGAASSKGRESPILNVFKGFMYFYQKHYSKLQVIILKLILSIKSILAIILFTLTLNKINRQIYIKALKIIW